MRRVPLPVIVDPGLLLSGGDCLCLGQHAGSPGFWTVLHSFSALVALPFSNAREVANSNPDFNAGCKSNSYGDTCAREYADSDSHNNARVGQAKDCHSAGFLYCAGNKDSGNECAPATLSRSFTPNTVPTNGNN
jgi:hypothetical protein